MSQLPKQSKGKIWLMVIPALVNVGVIAAGIQGIFSPPTVVMIIGIFSFFAMLAISSLFSEKSNLLEGEMRKAIASSMIMVYFAILSLTLIDPDIALSANPIISFSLENVEEGEVAATSSSLLNDFSTLIAVVIGFYFGGRSFEEVVKAWKGG
ncbi:hypothetical protein [Candidatus Leptofilum sp.]|uniref:hypothetical protein n=1 Tax=Candidatus Leptofilum sp. TaxID=3241576 RepID=UPI003B5A2D1D